MKPESHPPEMGTGTEELMRQSSLYQEFLAEREEILRHKWLESERLGYDIGFERALLDWIRRPGRSGGPPAGLRRPERRPQQRAILPPGDGQRADRDGRLATGKSKRPSGKARPLMHPKRRGSLRPAAYLISL